MLFFLLINVKMPTIDGILTFMSRKNSMLNSVEHEKCFITSGPGAFYLLIYVQSHDIPKAKRLLELLANRVVERQWVPTKFRQA